MTFKKLLKLAEQYETDARAIRRAVELMNGHQIHDAHVRFPATLRKAAKLRRKQIVKHASRSHRLQPHIQMILKESGPQSYESLAKHLTDTGWKFTRQQLVKAVMNLRQRNTISRNGRGQHARIWIKPGRKTEQATRDTP